MNELLETSTKQLTKHLEKGNITENEIALSIILDELSQLQQDKEELIKYCERLKKELKKYPEENPVELLNTHINIILRKLKESDKNE